MAKPPLDRFEVLRIKIQEKRKRRATRRGSNVRRWGRKAEGVAANFGRWSKVIAMLAQIVNTDPPQRGQHIEIKVPEVFSIIENPKLALSVIGEFASLAHEALGVRSISFDQQRLKVFDGDANALLDIVAVELVRQMRRHHLTRRLRLSGQFPDLHEAKIFVKAIGIIKHLNVHHERSPEALSKNVFEARNRSYYQGGSARDAEYKDRRIEAFVDHLQVCLQQRGRTLSPEGIKQLVDYVGEILTNAEEHAGYVDWTIQGYFDPTASVPVCDVAIFNFGSSIAETFEALPPHSFPRTQVQKYLDLHEKAKLFAPDWRREDLLTVIALQQGVSRLNTERTTRGQGTVQFIEFFQKVHAECNADVGEAKMRVISGGTAILFDGKYAMVKNDRGQHIIAFNSNNSLEERPDRDYVTPLAGLHFPGTIISIRFPLVSRAFTEDSHDCVSH